MDIQQTVAEAAIAAGVKRFIPSEFSADTASPEVLELIPFLSSKRQLIEFLRSKENTGMTWTAVPTSAFLDWGLGTGFMGFNLKSREVTLWDDGEAFFSANTRAIIGKALVAILSDKNLEKTKNQYVYLGSYTTSQKQILSICEKVTSSKWKIVERVDASERMKKVHEEMKNNDFSSALDLLCVATYGKEKEFCKWENAWNEKLGLAEQSLEEDIAAAFKGA
ncbi:NmrA-like protein [Macrophomina phaseolina MS6]|uniref:NmrA-like protein n=1 Tax=Macrophomina phaseolina (strain MS6) TaxID=1126212 RepID=K2QHJ3_MACPH|nr:NmrA-like protein [Macrophomina phaseolina MS6]